MTNTPELYEQKGLKSRAIEQYQKFLDLWKDADLDTPKVEDAKKGLARLKGEERPFPKR